MSRVGKHPVQIPQGVNITVAGQSVTVSGKLGSKSYEVHALVSVKHENGAVSVAPINDSKNARMQWGTAQRQIASLVKGVSEGFTLNLDLVGVGYRAAVQGTVVNLQLGFSHDVPYQLPAGVTAKSDKPTSLTLMSFDKQLLGQVGSEICSYRPAEPYKGKGVIPVGAFVLRKEGKKK